jgi:hypothetical protein
MRTLPLFYQEISGILPAARQKRFTTVHSEMTVIYWKIGERIIEKELQGGNRSEYGTFVNKDFSKDLTKRFGKGFSVTNIKNFRQFYLVFRGKSTAGPRHKELSWTHYRIIMRLKDLDARQYYVREAAEKNWSTRQLARNINEQYYNVSPPNYKVTPPKNKGCLSNNKACPSNNKGRLSNRELSCEKKLEEKRAARAALDQIYRDIAAMAAKVSTPDSVSNSDLATALYWGPERDGGKRFPDRPS